VETLLRLGLVNAAIATALAILVAAAGRLLTHRPAVLHCLWLLVLLKLVTPPLWDVPLPGWDPCVVESEAAAGPYLLEAAVEPEGAILEMSGVPEIPTGEASSGPPRWTAFLFPALGGVWVIGSMVMVVVAGIRVSRFRRLLGQSYPASAEVQDEVDTLAGMLGLSRLPEARWIDARLTPILWAVGCRPQVILPRELWDRLDRRQRSMLLVHEIAHVRRGDHLVRLFELLITTLFWWLPTVWWARRALHDVEEQCCDAWVTWAFPKNARSYAEALLETIDFVHSSGSREPVLATGFGKVHHLRKRLTMIMLGTTSRRLTWRGALGAFAAGALLLPIGPSWAQKPEDPIEERITIVETSDEAENPVIELRTGPAKTDFNFEFVYGDENEKTAIKADSLEQAKKLLEERIERLAKETGGSEAREAQIKALKQAIAGLEKARSSIPKVAGPDAKKAKELVEERRIYLRKLADEAKASPETKARIDKARARVDKIRSELNSKRKELAEAQLDLAKLSGKGASFTLATPEPKIVELHGKPRTVETRVVNRVDKTPSGGIGRGEGLGRGVGTRSLDSKDHERLEVLEKKLAELLEQVAKMKKQGQGEKAQER
jgi:beta-lactamase regulating signal transducer with metallopeptidase domain